MNLARLGLIGLIGLISPMAHADCTPQISLPAAGCRLGTVVASVPALPVATYTWSVDGGTIVSGLSTSRIVIAAGAAATLTVHVTVATPACSGAASASMTLREPFSVALDGGSGLLGQPHTITWSYTNGAPAQQVLTGSDFPAPIVLPPDARSYTYTPATDGEKSIVLQASVVTAPLRGRAAGRGSDSAAASCGSARAEGKYRIGCDAGVPVIDAPQAIPPGAPFLAHIALAAGATATWTITNGTPATATGDSVTIAPLSAAPVGISVVVSLGACRANAAAQVRIDPTLTCTPPAAILSVASSDCEKTVINVQLTGTPPFQATWSDGVPFASNDRLAQRAVTIPGDYYLFRLQDAGCVGQSNTLHVVSKVPSATLAINGSACAIDSPVAVVTFTGTPPFSGEWSDGVAFTTSSTRLERPMPKPADLTLKSMRDANCPGTVSGRARVSDQGTASVRLDSPVGSCAMYSSSDPKPPFGTIAVDMMGQPPYTVFWSDGSTQTSNSSPIRRAITSTASIQTFTIVRARDAFCDMKLLVPSVTVGVVPAPEIYAPAGLCPRRGATASTYNVPAGVSLRWRIANGTIQGASNSSYVTYTAGDGGNVTLSLDYIVPNVCTGSSSVVVPIYKTLTPPVAYVNPSTVNVGDKTNVVVTIDPKNWAYSNVTPTSPPGAPLTVYSCANWVCSFPYTATASGLVTFTVKAVGYCGDSVTSTVFLNVR